jgi:hypothetical protein
VTTIAEGLTKSEAATIRAYDLLEQVPDGALNRALTEALVSIGYLRRCVREQQKLIDRLLEAVPSAKVTP